VHEPLDARAAHSDVLRKPQLGVDGLDALGQPGVAEHAVAGQPTLPVIEPRAADAEQLAAREDRGAGFSAEMNR
jgi:hypothetical protein